MCGLLALLGTKYNNNSIKQLFKKRKSAISRIKWLLKAIWLRIALARSILIAHLASFDAPINFLCSLLKKSYTGGSNLGVEIRCYK